MQVSLTWGREGAPTPCSVYPLSFSGNLTAPFCAFPTRPGVLQPAEGGVHKRYMGAERTRHGGIKCGTVWQETRALGPTEELLAGVGLSPLQEKPSRCSS